MNDQTLINQLKTRLQCDGKDRSILILNDMLMPATWNGGTNLMAMSFETVVNGERMSIDDMADYILEMYQWIAFYNEGPECVRFAAGRMSHFTKLMME